MKLKKIQRTVVVTMGPLAEQVGAAVERWLHTEAAPQDAVTVIHLAADADPAARLTQALLSISHTTLRAKLRARGWRLDRLDEIGLYLVVDAPPAAGHDEPSPAQIATTAAQLAYDRLGVAAAGMLLALLPEGQNVAGAAWLAQQALLLHAFPRGVAALGLANEAGLHLPDANALATAVAHLLPAIISTPLRDGLDWSGSLGDADGMIISLGLAAWRWSPAGIQEKLAYRWMEAVLQQWRANETGPDAADQTAQAWLEQRQLLPEALVTQLWERLPVAAAPEWSYPQPWALAHLVESLCPDNVDDAAVLTSAGEQLGRQAGQALTAAVAALLDDRPVGGLALAQAWLASLARRLETCQDETADRQELIAGRQAATDNEREATRQMLDELLAAWPPPTLRAWLRAALQPWRWPGLAWQYLRIQQLGALLAQRCREQAQWRRHAALALAVQAIYRHFETAVRHAANQVEELHDLVGYLQTLAQQQQEKQPAPEDSALAWLPMAGLLAQPARAAQLAAQAVGGLGRQLTRPDDEAIWARLLDLARRQLSPIGELTAVDALLAQKAGPEALAEWWEQMCEQAAPLWRHDPAQLPDHLRDRRRLITLVCAQNIARLQERLAPAQTPGVRWLESPDPEQILALRVRQSPPAQSE